MHTSVYGWVCRDGCAWKETVSMKGVNKSKLTNVESSALSFPFLDKTPLDNER